MRTIIIGDIHGCHQEFEALLEKAKVTPRDQVICVGDVINKGPSTVKTLELVMRIPNIRCLIGNHEHRMLYHWRHKETHKLTKDYQLDTIQQFGPDIDKYMKFIESWPYYLEFIEFTVIHAGLKPGLPLSQQDKNDLVYLRALENGEPWYDSYTGSKLIVHGHWARQGLTVRDNVIGLDTGCVYGKKLTAVILPSREIISVDAKKTYVSIDS